MRRCIVSTESADHEGEVGVVCLGDEGLGKHGLAAAGGPVQQQPQQAVLLGTLSVKG